MKLIFRLILCISYTVLTTCLADKYLSILNTKSVSSLRRFLYILFPGLTAYVISELKTIPVVCGSYFSMNI